MNGPKSLEKRYIHLQHVHSVPGNLREKLCYEHTWLHVRLKRNPQRLYQLIQTPIQIHLQRFLQWYLKMGIARTPKEVPQARAEERRVGCQ